MPSIWGPRYVNEFASQLPEGLRVRVLGCKSITSQRFAFLLLLFFAVFLLILFVLVALFDFLIKKEKPLFKEFLVQQLNLEGTEFPIFPVLRLLPWAPHFGTAPNPCGHLSQLVSLHGHLGTSSPWFIAGCTLGVSYC